MLKSFKKPKNATDALYENIELFPEIVVTTVDGNQYNFRVNSGTSKNSTNILRIDLTNAVKYALVVEGFNQYNEKDNTVTGQVFLVATNEDQTIDKHLFAEDTIQIDPIKLNSETKLPDINDVTKVINDIWQESYIEAMDSTNDTDVTSGPSRKSSKKFGFKSILIVLTVIILLMVIGFKFLAKTSPAPDDSKQKITGMYNEISEQQQNQTKEGFKSVEQEALAEFGLKEGVKLD